MSEAIQICEEHLTLIRHLGVEVVGGPQCGTPSIDTKRPYGDSDIGESVCRTLGWEMEGDDGEGPCWSSKQLREAWKLHREVADALQVFLIHASLSCGDYVLKSEYDRMSWKRAEQRKES